MTLAEIPQEALQAATIALERELMSDHEYAMAADSDEALARVALEAALPALAAHLRRQDEEQRERTLLDDQEIVAEAEADGWQMPLIDRMASAIPLHLVKSEAVGIGGARREAIARSILPVFGNELARRADQVRRQTAERIAAALDDKSTAANNEAGRRVRAGNPRWAERASGECGAYLDAADIARQIGEAP